MQDNQRNSQLDRREIEFSNLLTGTAEMYGQNPSPAVFEIWFTALARFEMRDISRAFSVHIQNPDNGKFMPKPADIIRIIEGSGVDSAHIAWTKVEKASRMVGRYSSVVFDDPIIHRVVQDMGGWIHFCECSDEGRPFQGNEFRRRYQAFKTQGDIPEYLPVLIGLAEAENRANGFLEQITAPDMIGDPREAKRVRIGGTNRPALQITAGSNGAGNIKRIDFKSASGESFRK